MAKEALEVAEVDAIIHELEVKLQRLRAIYEQYFMGIERTPPHTLRKEVVRVIHRLENVYVRNTATKFKIRSLVQRFNSYKAYWGRIERQIEEGTYQRDIRRAQRNQTRRQAREGTGSDNVIDINLEDMGDLQDLQVELEAMEAAGSFNHLGSENQRSSEEKERIKQQRLAELQAQLLGGGGGSPPPAPAHPAPGPGQAAAQPAGRQPARPAASLEQKRAKLQEIKARLAGDSGRPSTPPPAPSGPSTDETRRVYEQLLAAKRSLNESTNGLSYDAVQRSMAAQRQQLENKRGAKDVEFKVVIKDGKAFLKPYAK